MASLIAAVQMGTLECHIQGVRVDKLQSPRRMIFDMDADEGLGFAAVRDAARLIRDLLAGAGLASWPLVTGGKGVHVTVPSRRTAGTRSVKLFARAFAAMPAERRPQHFTATLSKAARRGRIFIDWMRNDAGSTAATSFSLRARPCAPAAIPAPWDEMASLQRANAFDIRDALSRDWRSISAMKPGALSEKTVGVMKDTLSGL